MAHELSKKMLNQLAEMRELKSDDAVVPKITEHDARIARLYLERAARRIERYRASNTYMVALRIAARIIRESKPD